MNFLIRKDFFSKIPNEKIDEVQKDLKLFSRELIINNFIITKLKKGWKVDKITGTDGLLEFRVNQGDRIIFELTADNLVFWNWGKHDYAITTGKNINRDKDLLENFSIEINHKALLIDEIFLTEKLYDLEEIELSNEQIEVLHIKENLPCIVNGVPGSGKTLLIDHLLNSINSEALVLYISYNKKPIEKKNVRKITFEELFDIPRKIIGFDDFYEWFKQIKNSSFRPEDALDIWFYINNPNEKYHAVYLYALGPKHNKNIKFKNSKGKEVYQHQVYTINMQIEAATNKLTSVLCSIFEQNPDIPDGKTTYVVRKSFD